MNINISLNEVFFSGIFYRFVDPTYYGSNISVLEAFILKG
jgi:hypothetical protein